MLGKNDAWSISARKPGNTLLDELAAVMEITFFIIENGVKPGHSNRTSTGNIILLALSHIQQISNSILRKHQGKTIELIN